MTRTIPVRLALIPRIAVMLIALTLLAPGALLALETEDSEAQRQQLTQMFRLPQIKKLLHSPITHISLPSNGDPVDILDSFERRDISEPLVPFELEELADSEFGWGLSYIVPTNETSNAMAEIRSDLWPANDGYNGLYMIGHNDGILKEIYLTAAPVDVRAYQRLDLSLSYNLMTLEPGEGLEVQVGRLPAKRLDPANPRHWLTLAKTDPEAIIQQGMGWQDLSASLDLQWIPQLVKRSLVLRLKATMDNGFSVPVSGSFPRLYASPRGDYTLEDCIGIDTVHLSLSP
ncbi:MAG: hypothetical protein R6W92_06980 [Desulfocurvibacter africanus]